MSSPKVGLIAVFAAAAFAAPASASTVTLGAVSVGVPFAACGPGLWGTQTVGTGDPDYVIPAGYGVITSWIIRAGSTNTNARLKVVRGGPDTIQVVGQSDAQPLSGATAPGKVYAFATRISVAPQDRLGLFMQGGGNVPCGVPSTNGSAMRYYNVTDVSPPGTATAVLALAAPAYLNLQAKLESDADGDGYGDDTQDQCPTKKEQQTPCPDVKPPVVFNLSETNKRFRADAKAKPPRSTRKRHQRARSSSTRSTSRRPSPLRSTRTSRVASRASPARGRRARTAGRRSARSSRRAAASLRLVSQARTASPSPEGSAPER